MITVSILINGEPIYTRSAVNVTAKERPVPDVCDYKVDTGEIIQHRRSDGVVLLAYKLLGTIEEQ